MINILEIKFDIEGNIVSDFTDRDVPQYSHNVQKIRMYIPKEIFSDISMVNIHFENDDEIVMIDAVANLYDTTPDYRIYDFNLTNYYTQYIGKLRLQAGVNNNDVNVWTSFLYYVNVRKGVKGQSVVIDDPDIALQLQGEIDKLTLEKQDVATLIMPESITSSVNLLEEFYQLFYEHRDNATQRYAITGTGVTNITSVLNADEIVGVNDWKLSVTITNVNPFNLILLLQGDDFNYIAGMDGGLHLKHFTEFIDFSYLHILKERDIEHDEAIKDLQADLSYNNIGLLWVSKYDEETGNITYVLNPDFNYLIDDSRLEETGEIDWYVRPRNKEVTLNE